MTSRRTVRVVGVDVGVRGVPALNGTVHPATEALLASGAHGDTQHGAAAGRQKVSESQLNVGIKISHASMKVDQ